MKLNSCSKGLLLITCLVIAVSFYLQYIRSMRPCPLCLMQRAMIIGIGIVLLAEWVSQSTTRLKIILEVIFALLGLFFVSRQLWLQYLPADKMPACLPGLEVLLRYFSWTDVFQALFLGTSDCGEQHNTFGLIPLPWWSGLYFIIVMVERLIAFSRVKKIK